MGSPSGDAEAGELGLVPGVDVGLGADVGVGPTLMVGPGAAVQAALKRTTAHTANARMGPTLAPLRGESTARVETR